MSGLSIGIFETEYITYFLRLHFVKQFQAFASVSGVFYYKFSTKPSNADNNRGKENRKLRTRKIALVVNKM